jgi:SpoVK/Ycf46/Vps4 family AAA+-type ATPase
MIRPKLAKKKGKDLWDPDIVLNEKCLALRKTGLLEYIPFTEEASMANVGGMENLKEYIAPLQRAFTQEALDYGLTYPKGILLVGVPGTGKSLGAKALSGTLRHPLLKLDMGKIYQSLVGSSEANIRNALQVAEAIAPCILWMDEIEKGISGASAGALDSGVSARVLGTILTWMQEKKSPVYVYATANDISMLPPELLRKGRFDEMFSVDLPTRKERKEILEIHLRLRRRAGLVGKGAGKIDVDHFSNETSDGFTGAEIAGSLEQALRVCFHQGHELTSEALQEAFDSTQPISKTMQDRIEALRRWCKARTRPANRTEMATPTISTAPVQAGTGGRNIGMA